MANKLVLEKKKIKIDKIFENFENSRLTLFIDYRGLTVSNINEVRSELKENNSSASVFKNTLARKALKKLNVDYPAEFLEGPSLIVSGYTDAVATSKVCVKFSDLFEELKIKGGLLNEKVVSHNEIVALSKLPSRDVLIAKVIGSLKSPITGLVGTLSSPLNGFVNVIRSIKEKKLEEKND